MGISIKFVFHASHLKKDKTNEQNPLGFIYLQRIENRKKSYESLGLPKFQRSLWDKEQQRVRKNKKVDYNGYNDTIERKLKEVLDRDKAPLRAGESREKSFLKFCQKSVSSSKFSNKHGTRTKYSSVIKKLDGYLSEIGKTDLLFSELTVEFLDDFQSYMVDTGMETNTATHYLKVVNGFVRRSQVDRDIMNTYNPFDNFKFEKKRIKIKETLNREEVQVLLEFPIKNHRVDRVRKMFLFQFFCGGMRVSDLVTLRYKNLGHGRLSYVMFKTKHPLTFPITELIIDLLHDLVGLKTNIDSFVSANLLQVSLKDRKVAFLKGPTPTRQRMSPIPSSSKLLSVIDVPDFLFLEDDDFSSSGYNLPSQYVAILQSLTHDELVKEGRRISKILENQGDYEFKKGLTFSVKTIFHAKKVILERCLNDIKNQILQIRDQYYAACKNELHELSVDSSTRNQFVFDRLKATDFSNVADNEDFSNISEVQYKKVNRAGIVCNRNLNELQKVVGISKSLSTHLPRTSFTNIMMKDKLNHRDISRTLGHSSVSITDEYLKTGFNDGAVDSVIQRTSSDFSYAE